MSAGRSLPGRPLGVAWAVLLVVLPGATACFDAHDAGLFDYPDVSFDVDADGTGDPGAEDGVDGGQDDGAGTEGDTAADIPDDADAGEGDGSPLCGNGSLDADEECDDGNDVASDGCEPGSCLYSCHGHDDCLETPADDPCTTNTCETVTGGRRCASAPNPAATCDDSDVCTDGDSCDDSGACVPGTNTCGCPGGSDAECTVFEDGDLCNGTLVCNPVSRLCEANPSTIVTCPSDEPCRTFTCVPATGACPPTDRATGYACDDGRWCNGDDACDGAGSCDSSGDPCTGACRTCDEATDACNVVGAYCWIDGGCVADGASRPGLPCQICSSAASRTSWSHRADGYACSDGLWCNGVDSCDDAGNCTPGAGDP